MSGNVTEPAPLSPVFAALGDPNRLRIFCRLCAGGPASTLRLTEVIPVTRQAVTKHLVALEAVGLVRSQRQGRERIWTVQTGPLAQAGDYLGELSDQWDRRIDRLRALVETGD
jgi:DNA-binding transcriptional ArsR family regulator